MAVLLAIAIGRERQYLAAELVPSRAYYLLSAAGLTVNVAVITLSWLLGDSARKRAERERELAERTAELVAEREVNAQQAVISERLRIARELHDVVAHHVSVMGLQAGAARRIGSERPEEVEPALLRIEQASRDAVAELHRLLGFLRQEDQGIDADRPVDALDGSVPLPGLVSFDVLRRQVAAAGLAVSLTERGQRRDLTPAVDLSAYRILQESLTNVLRHAGVDRAEVTIEYRDDALHLAVADRGRRLHPTGAVGSRSGIVGMRERAALIGGTLRAGPRSGGGFEVEAVLPTTASPTEVTVSRRAEGG
jgi:signal transduction histidine kinase